MFYSETIRIISLGASHRWFIFSAMQYNSPTLRKVINIMTFQSLINNEYLLTIIDIHISLVDERKIIGEVSFQRYALLTLDSFP